MPTSFKAAREEREHDIAHLREGSEDDRAVADQLDRCRTKRPCWHDDCPVCRRRKERARRAMMRSSASVSIGGRACATLLIEHIKPSRHPRPLDQRALKCIQQTMQAVGLQDPIVVRHINAKNWVLVDGHHRLEAAKRLEWDRILSYEIVGDDLDAEIFQIVANLARADLRVLDKAEGGVGLLGLIRKKRRQEGQDAPPGGRQPRDIGINKAARRLGLSKERIRRWKRIAELPPQVKTLARKLGLDNNQSSLLTVAEGVTPQDQLTILRRLSSAKLAAKVENASAAQQQASIKRTELEGAIAKHERDIADISAKRERAQALLRGLSKTKLRAVNLTPVTLRAPSVSQNSARDTGIVACDRPIAVQPSIEIGPSEPVDDERVRDELMRLWSRASAAVREWFLTQVSSPSLPNDGRSGGDAGPRS